MQQLFSSSVSPDAGSGAYSHQWVVPSWSVDCEVFHAGNCYGLLAYFSPVSQLIILYSFFYQRINRSLINLNLCGISTSALSWVMT